MLPFFSGIGRCFRSKLIWGVGQSNEPCRANLIDQWPSDALIVSYPCQCRAWTGLIMGGFWCGTELVTTYRPLTHSSGAVP
jgi:hypothetical protein